MYPITANTDMVALNNSFSTQYEKVHHRNMYALIGMHNIYGTVVSVCLPKVVSSNSYDCELTFDSGVTGVRWDASSFKKMSYYQSNEYNLTKDKHVNSRINECSTKRTHT